jgi:hypothetical protein
VKGGELGVAPLPANFFFSQKYTSPAPPPPTRLQGEAGGRIGTNLQNEGLISADRGTKATLTLTIPCSLFKSYTKDFSFPTFELVFQYRPSPLLCEQRYRYNIMILDHPER